jgi:hypothetical protein
VDSTGLTCSSFVVEVLRGFHLDLIDESTWPSSDDNVKWANDIAAFFADIAGKFRTANQNQVAEMYEGRAKVIAGDASQGLRLLPTEVAGAVSMAQAGWPVAYQDAQGPANLARTELSQAIATVMAAQPASTPVVAAAAVQPPQP